MDHRFYTTGQFACKAAVSLRTLRYYDKVGLLSPAQHSEAGYRLYTDKDLLKLQQILALKFLGFTLQEIKSCLQSETRHLREVLAQQKAMMYEKRAQLDAIIQALETTEQQAQAEQWNWDALVRVIQVMQMEQKDAWVKRYFTDEQIRQMKALSEASYSEEARQRLSKHHPREWTEEDQKRVDEQYAFLAAELKRLVASGADPAGPEAQAAAKLQSDLLYGFTQGDPEIIAGLKNWWQNHNALPEEQRPVKPLHDKEEAAFLAKAMEIYRQEHGQ